MPFWLNNAPRTFQKAVCIALQGLPFVRIYLDDILIFRKSSKEHPNHVKTVLDKLCGFGFALNFEKWEFFKDEVSFLGRKLSSEGLTANIEEKMAMNELKWAKTIKTLQRLFGTINWFRNFIANLSQRITVITEKLKNKNKIVEWEETEKETIRNVFKDINRKVQINHPNPNKAFTLFTDASDQGIGPVLRQKENIVGLYSKKLNQSEKNYTTMEKELQGLLKLCIISETSYLDQR